MAASEAAVTAVMEMLGCERFNPAPDADFCEQHPREALLPLLTWTDRGCPVAVAAADAAVDADRASIQAETLREAADEVVAELVCCDIFDGFGRGGTGNHAICYWGGAVEKGLRARADRIEGKP